MSINPNQGGGWSRVAPSTTSNVQQQPGVNRARSDARTQPPPILEKASIATVKSGSGGETISPEIRMQGLEGKIGALTRAVKNYTSMRMDTQASDAQKELTAAKAELASLKNANSPSVTKDAKKSIFGKIADKFTGGTSAVKMSGSAAPQFSGPSAPGAGRFDYDDDAEITFTPLDGSAPEPAPLTPPKQQSTTTSQEAPKLQETSRKSTDATSSSSKANDVQFQAYQKATNSDGAAFRKVVLKMDEDDHRIGKPIANFANRFNEVEKDSKFIIIPCTVENGQKIMTRERPTQLVVIERDLNRGKPNHKLEAPKLTSFVMGEDGKWSVEGEGKSFDNASTALGSKPGISKLVQDEQAKVAKAGAEGYAKDVGGLTGFIAGRDAGRKLGGE